MADAPNYVLVAHHLFGAKLPLVYRESGSDDKTFDWVLVFWLLILSISVASVWSMLDRRRPNYNALQKWFRQFIRLVLASELFMFGMAKVMSAQMPFPSLAALVRPLGSLSRYSLLWVSIGGSPGYEIFAGCAEVAGHRLGRSPTNGRRDSAFKLPPLGNVFGLS